eukprot:TRINITY_DN40669_c0_g3_i1.p1 TRINITY_DN40669_c0_g3~~TRINITY_DN40669_c0_g3_i1.p1  ORF type:complete len:731 (-),score=109.83 TRINITY_DN40669_c0_g3_i1:126-2318(-)
MMDQRQKKAVVCNDFDSGEEDGTSSDDATPRPTRRALGVLGRVAPGVALIGGSCAVAYFATRSSSSSSTGSGLRPTTTTQQVSLTGSPGPASCGNKPSGDCQASIDWAKNVGVRTNPQWYPGLDLSSSDVDFQKRLADNKQHGCVCLPVDTLCTPAPASADCKKAVDWAIVEGIRQHPEWYHGLNVDASWNDFHGFLAANKQGSCVCSARQDSGDETMATDMPCTDKESCLKVVDAFLDDQARSPLGMVQTFGENTQGGGPCGELCQLAMQCPGYEQVHKCRFDTYDNALTVIYYSERGNFDAAQRILDGFMRLLYPDTEVPGVTYGVHDELPSKRYLTLLAASYYALDVQPGSYWGDAVADGAVDTGNNAWVAIAFARFSAAANKPCYALPARDILTVLNRKVSCDDDLKGFMARLPPYERLYRSTEHNIDMYALARMLGDEDAAASAANFVGSMRGYSNVAQDYAAYSIGTDGKVRCDTSKVETGAVPVDTQLWNTLAGAVTDHQKLHAALNYTLRTATFEAGGGFVTVDTDLIGNAKGEGKGDKYHGFSFSNVGWGVQWENTASGVMALITYRDKHGSDVAGLDTNLVNMRDSLKRMLGRYGSVLGSSLGGNLRAFMKNDPAAAYPGGSSTGLGWNYMRYPHTAATAWTGLLLMLQSEEGEVVDVRGNPYAPPTKPLADLAASTAPECLSGGAAAGPKCSLHAGCASLHGNCCPTNSGHMLSCCSGR